MASSNPETQSDRIAADVHSRLQLIVTIAVFFPTVVYFFYNKIGSDADASRVALAYAGPVALYLADYFLFELLKNKIQATFLMKIVDFCTLIGVLAYIIPISYLVSGGSGDPLEGYLSYLSLYGLYVIPIVVLIMLISYLSYYIVLKMRREDK